MGWKCGCYKYGSSNSAIWADGGFQSYPKSLYPASRLRDGEVERYLWARPESKNLLLPTFHWPEVVTWHHLATREVGKCSFWLGIHISATLWNENVNLYWEDWHHVCTRDSVQFLHHHHTSLCTRHVLSALHISACSLGTIISQNLQLLKLKPRVTQLGSGTVETKIQEMLPQSPKLSINLL